MKDCIFDATEYLVVLDDWRFGLKVVMTEFVKIVHTTVKGGMVENSFPEVKAGQALISGIAIASNRLGTKTDGIPCIRWS